MTRSPTKRQQFAVCINNVDYSASLKWHIIHPIKELTLKKTSAATPYETGKHPTLMIIEVNQKWIREPNRIDRQAHAFMVWANRPFNTIYHRNILFTNTTDTVGYKVLNSTTDLGWITSEYTCHGVLNNIGGVQRQHKVELNVFNSIGIHRKRISKWTPACVGTTMWESGGPDEC